MAKTKSSTKTAALRSDAQDGGVSIPVAKTEAHAALFHKHDACHILADDLHSLVLCFNAVTDTQLIFEGAEEKECALAFIGWQIVLKSRELQAAFK